MKNVVDFGKLFREVAPGVGLPVDFNYSTPAARGAPAITLHVRFCDGTWTPTKLELEASPNEPLTTANVRIPLGRLMQDALGAAARPLVYDVRREDGTYRRSEEQVMVVQRLRPDGKREHFDTTAWILADAPPRGELADRWQGMSSEELSAAVIESISRPRRLEPIAHDQREHVAAAAVRRPRAPIPMTDDGLAEIADRYRVLVATGQRNPTVQIAAERHVSRMTASRWLRRARDLKLLGEARPGPAQLDPQ